MSSFRFGRNNYIFLTNYLHLFPFRNIILGSVMYCEARLGQSVKGHSKMAFEHRWLINIGHRTTKTTLGMKLLTFESWWHLNRGDR